MNNNTNITTGVDSVTWDNTNITTDEESGSWGPEYEKQGKLLIIFLKELKCYELYFHVLAESDSAVLHAVALYNREHSGNPEDFD